MARGMKVHSKGLGMNDLMTMSKQLEGLSGFKLHDAGMYVYVVPKQIITEAGGEYLGLPELVMAEGFTNIPPTLQKEYENYKHPDKEFHGVFEYDLNKHLIDNILDFRDRVRNEEWFNAQSKEIQELIRTSKLYIEEDGEKMIVQKASLVNESKTEGSIIDHIMSYNVDPVFFADPQIQYKLTEDGRFNTTSVLKRIESEEDSELYGAPIGSSVETPWQDFQNQYSRAFYKLYIDPIKEKHPQLDWKELSKLPEYEEAKDKELIKKPQFRIVSIMARIPVDERDEIQLKPGDRIPTRLSRLTVKENQWLKYFQKDKTSDIHYDPSFMILKVKIPKRGEGLRAFLEQYKGMEFNKPEVVTRHNVEDPRVPTTHPGDKEFSKRMKEEILNFPFKETYVAGNKSSFGASMKPSAINEIIRNIALPMYSQLGEIGSEGEGTRKGLKYFLTKSTDVTEEELDALEEDLEETGGQFSGKPVEEPAPQTSGLAGLPPQTEAPQEPQGLSGLGQIPKN